MTRTARTLYTEALDALIKGRMAEVLVARDWEMLREIARLAKEDAPLSLSSTDPALFMTWREAVTKYHVKGWTHMTPERIDAVCARHEIPLPPFSPANYALQRDPGETDEEYAARKRLFDPN
ncbi:MAG: hypothetical protein RO009_23035 [Pseudorhodoplanes sp.]|jgi:hypothetical protein|nr:hypothetical protein [Pseudorhodoplanes sp.]